MLKQRLHSLGLLTLTCLGLGFGSVPAWGSQFGQKDVDQTKYAVVAMPIARGDTNSWLSSKLAQSGHVGRKMVPSQR